MNHVIRHIEYLLSRNDCVIIPGLGAILAQYVPARYDVESGYMLPPHRIFTFNSAVTDNDGLLVNSVSRAMGISMHRALQLVRTDIDNMKRELISRRHLTIGTVGTLFYDATHNTCSFSPSSDAISVATMWLMPVPMSPMVADKKISTVIDAPIKKRRWNLAFEIGRVAAVVALVIGAWFIASSPFPVDDAMQASLVPEINLPHAHDVDHSAALAETTNVDCDESTEASDYEDKSDVRQPKAEATEAHYFVIVMAAPSIEDAQKYVSMYPNHDLAIKQFGSQFRVYVSAHATADEASAGCIKARADFPNAWVCNL